MQSVNDFLNRLREDGLTLALTLALLVTVGWAVAAAEWVEGIRLVVPIILIAGLFGYLIAIARFSGLTAALMIVIDGCFTVWVYAGRQIETALTFRERLLDIAFRFGTWLEQAAGGGFSRDNLIFLILAGLLAWFVAVNTIWHIFHTERLWQATIPVGAALLVNAYYTYGPIKDERFIGAFLLITFALAVQTNAISRERIWRRERISHDPNTGRDLRRGGIVAVLSLVAFSWMIPTISTDENPISEVWQNTENPWMEIQHTFERLFNDVRGGYSSTPSYYAASTLTLGGPVSLEDSPVLAVHAPGGYRYYWRSKIFDVYLDGTWLTHAERSVGSGYGVLALEEADPYRLRENVQQHFTVLMPSTRLLYGAPQTLSYAAVPVTYYAIDTQSQSYATVTEVHAQQALETGDDYSVLSSISFADEASLRQAGEQYPGWVVSRYMLLPDDALSPRTVALAAQIADPYDNPYDIARAIERYLRDNITYNERVEAPPEGADPIDYLLFESKEGYCTYYASAMTLMLRSLHIPARIAAGFAQGTYDAERDQYVVTEADAHTWVEVYFPDYGWVEFEPTAAESPIERPATFDLLDQIETEAAPPTLEEELAGEQPEDDFGRDFANLAEGLDFPQGEGAARRIDLGPVFRWVGGLIGVFTLLVIAGWYMLEFRGTRSLSEAGRSYARLNTYAPLVGVDLAESDTPHERARQLIEAFPDLAHHIKSIVDLYVLEQYSPLRLSELGRAKAANQSREAWRAVRKVFVRALLKRRVFRIGVLRRGGVTVR